MPTLKKALCSASSSAMTTAAGVSIITPTGTEAAARTPSRGQVERLLQHQFAVSSTSSTRVTSGSMS